MAESAPFKSRGIDTTRMEAFVDAAFAFATTLLVISFNEIPSNYAELVVALKGIPGFLASFAIIAMFWVGHRNWSNQYGLDTTFSTLISLALVCVILVYVYPLRTMMAAVFELLTNGWIPRTFHLTNLDEVRGLFTIYGSGFVLASSCLLLLYIHAWRQRYSLALSEAEIYASISEIIGWVIMIGVGVFSILLAWVLPENWLALAGWAYALLSVFMPGFAIIRARKAPVT